MFKKYLMETADYYTLKLNAKLLPYEEFMDKYSIEGSRLSNQNKIFPHNYLKISDIDPSEYDSWEETDLNSESEKYVTKLQQSLRKNEIIKPILVTGNPEDKKYRPMVLDGHHVQ